MAIAIETLTDGGQRPADVARGIAGFLSQARRSLDIALYDVRFETDAGALVLASLLGAVQRGVEVRLLYNLAHPGPIPVPPPPETTPAAIEALPVATRGIAAFRTSCTTSSSSATAQRCGAARRTGRTTRGRVRRTSSSPSSRRRSPTGTRSRSISSGNGVTSQAPGRSIRDPQISARRASAPGSAPSTARRSRTGSRSTSARRRNESGSRHPCSPRARSSPRSSRS